LHSGHSNISVKRSRELFEGLPRSQHALRLTNEMVM
jgi:hypothetical protein